MLHIRVVCVGRLKERFYADALAEYEKRLSPFCRFEVVELPEERLSEKPKPAEAKESKNSFSVTLFWSASAWKGPRWTARPSPAC